MIKLQQLLSILFFFTTTAFAQNKWEWSNPKPSGYSCINVHFLSKDTGFILNTKEILSTTDCGIHWTKLKDIPNPKDMAFKNSCGYIVGDAGYIAKSLDGGKSWSKIASNITENLMSVSLVSEDSIFISGLAKLFKSFDGGKTWQTSEILNTSEVYKIVFQNSLVGHAASDLAILKTKDGGKTWYTTNSTSSNSFTLQFITDKIGYATRGYSDLYKTTNGGESWKKIYTSEDLANSICFIDTNNGFIAGGDGMIVKTTNAGKTWNSMIYPLKFGSDLNSICFIDTTIGFAVGYSGRIMKTIDGGISWEPYSPTYSSNSDMTFPSDTVGYSGGGNLIKTTNGGQSWNRLVSPTSGGVSCMHFFNNDTGLIAGNGLWKTVDGGLSWRKSTTINYTDWQWDAMYFINERVGFISGDDGGQYRVFAKTIDAGETWNVISNYSMNQITFLNENIGYGLVKGLLHKTNDGGITWNPIKITSAGNEDLFSSFDFLDANWGYVVGLAGMAYKTIDGGNSWQKQSLPYNDFTAIQFLNKNIGYTTSQDGSNRNIVFKTINGGNSWQEQSIPEIIGFGSDGFSSIAITKNNFVYVTGGYGMILKDSISTDTLSNAVSTVVGNNDKISIYPNPANNILNIVSYEEPYQVELLSPSGQVRASVTQQRSLNISDIEDGLYFIRIYFTDAVVFRKIIKY